MSLNLDRSTWKRVSFGDVVNNVNETVRDANAAGIDRIIAMEHLDPGELKMQRWGSIEDGTTFTRRVKPGQTLFGKRRAYQRKVAYAECDAICSGDIYTFEADESQLLGEFLPFLVQSNEFFDHALDTSAGSLSPRTNWRDLATFEFDLPPLDEQKRLADLLWAVERDSQAQAERVGALRDLRRAHLQQRMTEIASAAGTVKLDALVEPGRPITYGILMPGSGHPGGVPVVKVKDFPDGYIHEDDLLLTTPELAHEYRRSTLRSGDLLISIRGTVGRLAEVPLSLEGANITQDTARLSMAPEHDRQYVRLVLESEFAQAQIRKQITGLAVKGLNIGALRKLQIPVPSASEAELALVRESRQIDWAIARAAAAFQACRALRQSLLAAVFGGN